MKYTKKVLPVIFAMALTMTPVQSFAAEETYTVKGGDTLYKVSKLFNVTVNELKEWNHLTDNSIATGQKLFVNEKAALLAERVTYTVQKGDTLYSVAKKYTVSTAKVKEWNDLKSDTLFIGQTLIVGEKLTTTPTPVPNPTTYTVKAGDTLYRIATTYKVTTTQIKQWNNLKSDALFVGQKLTISGTATTSPTPTTPTTTTTYTVKAGDTLYRVATTYKVTTTQIKQWNNLKSDALYVGQKLTIGTTNTTTPTPTTPTTTIYTVKAGDTLYRIAKTYNVTTTQIKQWNNLKSETVTVGQKLSIGGTSTGGTTTPTTKTGTITASLLNVRSGAGTSYGIVGTVKKGDKVTIIEEKSGWMNISFNGTKGWISDDYVSVGGTTAPTPTETNKYVVTASQLYLRQGPSTSDSIVATLSQGTVVTLIKTQSGWSQVSVNGKTGWVSSTYIQKQGSGSSSAPKGKTIVLDAGHGGVDPGAVAADGTKEENLTLGFALKTQQALINRGYKVIMVRTSDTSCLSSSASTSEELQCRINLVPKNNANAYVSIHINSATPAARGSESYYNTSNPYPSDSERLARAIHNKFQPVFGSLNRGVQTANYYVIKRNTMPATLLEIGFLSNSSDLAKMKSSSMQSSVANAIAEGIDQYFGY